MFHMLSASWLALTTTLSGWPAQPVKSCASVVRYCYEGGTLKRDGRLLPVDDILSGRDVLKVLREDGADLDRFTARVYDPELAGWAPLTEATEFAEEQPDTLPSGQPTFPRVDVQLFRRRSEAEQSEMAQEDGFFSVGVVGLKNEHNLGTLWRSAYQSGAATLFVVGARYQPQTSDTVKAWRNVPLVSHPDWNHFAASSPYGAVLVAVEMGGEPLEHFEHPERALYILGSEDSGLPESVIRACHRTVSLPSQRCESFNVAVAGSVVMYDRLAKERRKRSGLDAAHI
eukprot:CAMPEP_0115853686 /NCGR_PEP_ID=MMETSP0287-20121206/13633_1 /TAXON_ID=412157 /ORGANISM="Chrysochromulina rotalis, Strain UIO044" /LENGTH=285 /DNA_ID=CAMNT_0003307773 /DNA_START=67 /DNA_END=924 /DNA_ORIENTATION=-